MPSGPRCRPATGSRNSAEEATSREELRAGLPAGTMPALIQRRTSLTAGTAGHVATAAAEKFCHALQQAPG